MNEPVTGGGFGAATLTPTEEVVAGTYGTWTITYTVGELGMDDGATLLVAYSQTSDMGTPQFEDPGDENYSTVEVSGSARASARFDPDANVRPYQGAVRIDLANGSLAPGDSVTLTLGATGGGSPGLQAQSFVERGFRFPVLVDPHGTGQFEELSVDIGYDVVAGRARSLHAVLPSTTPPGEPVTLAVRAEDYWGNVADSTGPLAIEAPAGIEAPPSLELTDGTGQATVTVTNPGTHRVTVRDEQRGLEAETNPLVADDFDRQLFWGDLHGQSGETVGTGTVEDYFAFARDAAFCDFAAHAGNDFQISDAFWATLQSTVRSFNDPGSFVTFLCYEWSANTALGGDHNVYFRNNEADLRRSSNWQVAAGENRLRGLHPVEALYDHFAGRDDVLVIPHQGGRPATVDGLDPVLTPFVEIASVWGVFEWFGREALDRLPVGFIGGSDDHCGRPGTAPPDNLLKHNVSGGLMGVRAETLDRDALWDAFTDRRVYATTGARILLETTVDGVGMGGETTVDHPPTIEAAVHGTAPLRRIDVFRGGNRIASEDLTDGSDRIEVRWTGSRGRTRDKLLDWSGGVTLERGEILDVEDFGFDHPQQGVTHVGATAVEWTAYTSGNVEGVRLSIDAPADAVLGVHTPPTHLATRLEDLEDRRRIDTEGLDARLELGRTGSASTRETTLAVTDDAVDGGTHPYYVRVEQMDGERAWSSPVFVTVN